jgi:hypothetical protein
VKQFESAVVIDNVKDPVDDLECSGCISALSVHVAANRAKSRRVALSDE